MFTGGRIPDRLTPPRASKGWGSRRAAALTVCLALGASACVSSRYVGSLGASGFYSNRGYGIAIDFTHADLLDRWTVIDPVNPAAAPAGFRLVERELPLDLNADGTLHQDERVRFTDPTLRMLSKTSTASWIDLDMAILTGKAAKASLDDLMATYLRDATGSVHDMTRWEKRKLGPDFDARVAEISESGLRMAVIDHSNFEAEDGVKRRQILQVVLRSDALNPQLRADHNFVLRAIALNAVADRQSRQERY